MENKVRAHAYVSGIVQGVWYRASTRNEAVRIGGLSGWVKNLPDGRVEVMCEGNNDLVEHLINWLWQGPPNASVSDVDVEWRPAKGDLSSFEVT